MTSTARQYPASLWKKDDWLSNWVAFVILGAFLLGLAFVLPDLKWTGSGAIAAKHGSWTASVQDVKAKADAAKESAVSASAGALLQAIAGGNRADISAAARALGTDAGKASSDDVKTAAGSIAASIAGDAARTFARVFSGPNLLRILYLFIGLLVLAGLSSILLGRSLVKFLAGFPVLFILALGAMVIAGNTTISYYGLEYVIWALVIGLLISNTIGLPSWMKEAVNTEFYIKVGLVLLGAELLFRTILSSGVFGMVQALVVITAVWYFCYWLAGRFGVDKEFAAILSTGVSVCGVSAAIAAGGALKGDPKKVSHTISLILIVAIPMLVLEPIVARALHLEDGVTGAWLGGTIDTTGAVVAAGTIAGKKALDTAVVVKLSQNALIGVVAFLLSLWASLRKREGAGGARASEIWDRFPKFVLGFIVASVVFSLLVPAPVATKITGVTTGIRGYWFALAFLSIGLETRIKDLVSMEKGRPALAFLGAQAFNILWTMLIAFLLFGGVIFPRP
jgi:uncharacterized integral membrane protein (TIGR00698 family)